MGGKSRKSGGVSKKLIQTLLNKKDGKKSNCGNKKKIPKTSGFFGNISGNSGDGEDNT